MIESDSRPADKDEKVILRESLYPPFSYLHQSCRWTVLGDGPLPGTVPIFFL
jgi:hypothetical protein